MSTMMFLELAVSTAMLVTLLFMTNDVRAIRKRILADPQRTTGTFSLTSHCGGTVSGSFVVWEWRQGEWHPDVDSLPHGMEPGLPPSFPGVQDGHRVKTWAEGSRS